MSESARFEGANGIPIETRNEFFYKYYRSLFLEHNDSYMTSDEFDAFIRAMETPLPLCFRVSERSPFRGAFLSRLREINKGYKPRTFDELGSGLYVYDALTKLTLKKDERNRQLWDLVREFYDINAVFRLEAVSYLPVACLAIDANTRTVLDMCAAPGSKSTQIIDVLGTRTVPDHQHLFIANDVNPKRTRFLSNRISSMGAPYALTTSYNAKFFPEFVVDGSPLRYDRILADVPCSCDGTFRKAPDAVPQWKPSDSLGLHELQFQIACRGFELLKPGGTMIYSTCSLSPIENEAVICRLVEQYRGYIDIEFPSELEGIARRGVSNWQVMVIDSSGNDGASCSLERTKIRRREVTQSPLHGSSFHFVADPDSPEVPSHLLPSKDKDLNRYVAENSARIFPNSSLNSGAFFLCRIHKRKELEETRTIPRRNPTSFSKEYRPLLTASDKQSIDLALSALHGDEESRKIVDYLMVHGPHKRHNQFFIVNGKVLSLRTQNPRIHIYDLGVRFIEKYKQGIPKISRAALYTQEAMVAFARAKVLPGDMLAIIESKGLFDNTAEEIRKRIRKSIEIDPKVLESLEKEGTPKPVLLYTENPTLRISTMIFFDNFHIVAFVPKGFLELSKRILL